MKKIPIGISDFKTIITENYCWVDKTLLIKALLDDGAGVTLFTRPRRFGKTLNLSMINYFFSNTQKDTLPLFHGLNIEKCGPDYMHHQGQYPVIFLSLKDVKTKTIDEAYIYIEGLLAEVYSEHRYLLNSEKLFPEDKAFFQSVLERGAPVPLLVEALRRLTYYLHQHHDKKVIILLDEYDTPIHEAYLHGFYEDMMNFMRNFFAKSLKDNNNLQQAVLTGILRASKESIFSGLNHLKVHSVFGTKFGEFFGFTQAETENLFKEAGLENQMTEVEDWYNGYKIAGSTIYNPWSILHCIDQRGLKQPYWVNTASNTLIKQLLGRGSIAIKENIELLLQGQPIQVIVSEHMSFRELSNDDAALWHLLVFAGYLTVIDQELTEDYQLLCHLAIPNKEVSGVYSSIIKTWFQPAISDQGLDELLFSLTTGNISRFKFLFEQLIRDSLSYFDITGKQPERVYHAFVLGLIARLRHSHMIKSNRESGYGRYDVMLIPKDHTQLGIIIEFKTLLDEKNLEEATKQAMQQINDKQYDAELWQLGINRILKIAIGFSGKEILVLTQ